MIRTLTIVAAAVALLLPAGRYIDDALGTDVKSGYALGTLPPPGTEPPRLATRAGGEVVSSDAYAKATPHGVASFSIDVGTSEALKHITDGTSNTLALSTSGPNGIIAILIG